MKHFKIISVSIFLTLSLLSGCSGLMPDLEAFGGMGVKDLERAKSDGVSKTFDLSTADVFDKTLSVLEKNKLTVYQSNKRKGYIVFMGIEKQTDTTRVGVFFRSVNTNKTKVTISSLSSSARTKGELIIFKGLSE